MIETVVDSIKINMRTNVRVVCLREKTGDRLLPIWIGEFEAAAIAMELQGSVAPRPMTHDLIKSIIGDLGGTVERVVVTDLSQEIFFATIVITADGRSLEVDCRPSDAIAVAVRLGCPIMVSEMVMDRAGITSDPDESEIEDDPIELGLLDGDRSSPGDDDRLSVFRDFINTLDLDDFEKRQGN